MDFPFKTRPGQVTAYLAGLSFAALAVTAGAPRNWAVSLPDVVHTYGIRFRSGADLFFRPPVGWYIEHGHWVCLGAVGLSLIVEVATRRLHRPDVAPDGD
ncbi:MAG: hypothetical protein AB7H96_14980 [Vicinamibacterales bacterium]